VENAPVMPIAVTGSSGFIGSHVVDELVARGLDVHAMATRPTTRPGVTTHAVDLLGDRSAIEQLFARVAPTHLLHLAWYAEPGQYWTSLENYRWAAATVELARIFRERGGTRMVAIGTCAEYDHRDGICREDSTPLAPTTPYGVAKDATRRLLASYAEQSGLGMAWARIFFLYGPGERSERLVPAVIQACLRGEAPRCTEGLQIRDFLHVRDVAAALVDTLLSDVTGAVNIGSGEPVTVRQLVTDIAAECGATQPPAFGALPSRDEAPSIVADVTRLRDEVQWQPRYSRREGLRDTIAWWRTR
jgi:nucleoside-diphosphate-sugar epimerase